MQGEYSADGNKTTMSIKRPWTLFGHGKIACSMRQPSGEDDRQPMSVEVQFDK